jgi:hypothetical protein
VSDLSPKYQLEAIVALLAEDDPVIERMIALAERRLVQLAEQVELARHAPRVAA